MKENKKFNIIEDEKELDDIFSSKGNKLQKAIKKAKRDSIIRTFIISIIVVVVLAGVSNILCRELVYKLEGTVQISEDRFNEVSAPNKYKGKISRYHNYLNGRSIYTTYKILEDKIVYTGEKEYHYGLFLNHQGNLIGTESPSILGYSYNEEDLKQKRFNELGQREMVFFYPYVKYGRVFNDLSLLDNMPDNKYMEFALSFDQEYTIDEVKALIPNNVTLAWYWVDDIPQEERNKLQSYEVEEIYSNGEKHMISHSAKVRSERTAYGIKAYNREGEFYQNPEELFLRAIERGKEEKSRYQGQFIELYNNFADENGTLNKDNINILGVVVTGDKEGLDELKELSFIRASSLGVVVDKL